MSESVRRPVRCVLPLSEEVMRKIRLVAAVRGMTPREWVERQTEVALRVQLAALGRELHPGGGEG